MNRKTKRPHVLVVDDSSANAFVAERFLQKLGAEVEIACNGQSGVDCCSNGSFDLVLMDISMPIMDGYEATKMIRLTESDSKREQCPIVALSAHASEEVKQMCLEIGMNDHYTKPISFSQMQELLERYG